MAEFKSIPIDKIFIPERLRDLEEDHALAIAQSIVEHGLLNPITVRKTPAAEHPYTLVAGRHRLRGVELNGESEIDATIVEADKAESQLIEITENLFRNELSMLDRAIFVATYRDVWEGKYGKISRGGDQKSKVQDAPLIGAGHVNLLQVLEDEAETGGFASHVAARMGVSKDVVKRLNKISQNLHPEIRSAIRGTAVADNQSVLLKLAKLEPKKQRQAALAFRQEGDIKRTFALIDDRPRAKVDPQAALLSRLISAWESASPKTKKAFMAHLDGASK
jgi:ParB family chromosome partitioning protein